MKYFGILNTDNFKSLDNTEKLNYLINNNLFEYASDAIYIPKVLTKDEQKHMTMYKQYLYGIAATFHIIKMFDKNSDCFYYTDQIDNNIGIFMEEPNSYKILKIEPIQGLLDMFYEDLIKNFKSEIISEKYQFYEKFNDTIFGLDYKKQTKRGLKSYKKIYKSLQQDNATFIGKHCGKKKHDFAIENKLKSVLYIKLKYQHSLNNLDSYLEYLYGDESYLNNTVDTENIDIIDSVIKYESRKQIMQELNGKYNFEHDLNVKNKPAESDHQPISNFIKHKNNIEIEKIIKIHFSELSGKNLRYLIEYLKEENVLFLNYGDKMKIYNSISTLFGGKNIGAYTTIFDAKVFSNSDQNYINSKSLFKKVFEDIL